MVILLATGAYAIVLFSRLARTFDTTVAEQYRSLVAVQQMNLALAGLDREAWTATGPGNTRRRQAVTESRKRFEENLALQLTNASLPSGRELNQRLAGRYAGLQRGSGKMGSTSRPKIANAWQ